MKKLILSLVIVLYSFSVFAVSELDKKHVSDLQNTMTNLKDGKGASDSEFNLLNAMIKKHSINPIDIPIEGFDRMLTDYARDAVERFNQGKGKSGEIKVLSKIVKLKAQQEIYSGVGNLDSIGLTLNDTMPGKKVTVLEHLFAAHYLKRIDVYQDGNPSAPLFKHTYQLGSHYHKFINFVTAQAQATTVQQVWRDMTKREKDSYAQYEACCKSKEQASWWNLYQRFKNCRQEEYRDIHTLQSIIGYINNQQEQTAKK